MKKVIVFGSLNMDLTIKCDYIPKNGETLNGSDFFTNPGGKGGNQAVAAAKLGADTQMIASVGNDAFGDEILDKLKEYHVDTTYVEKSEFASTGVAMIIRCNNDNRIILSNGANHAMSLAQVKKSLDAVAKPGDIFLTQLENETQCVIDAIHYAKSLGLYTILNPAPARVLEDELYRDLDLIIVNQSECQILTSINPIDDVTCMQGLKAFAKKGVKSIITLGSKGSITDLGDEPLFIPSKKVDVVDTTAAGDSYIGGFCTYLAQGKSMKESLEFATEVASLTIGRVGAQISIPTIDELNNMFEERNHE